MRAHIVTLKAYTSYGTLPCIPCIVIDGHGRNLELLSKKPSLSTEAR